MSVTLLKQILLESGREKGTTLRKFINNASIRRALEREWVIRKLEMGKRRYVYYYYLSDKSLESLQKLNGNNFIEAFLIAGIVALKKRIEKVKKWEESMGGKKLANREKILKEFKELEEMIKKF